MEKRKPAPRAYGNADGLGMNIVALPVAGAGPEDGSAALIQTDFDRFADSTKLDNREAFVFPPCTDVSMLPKLTAGRRANWPES